MPVYISIQFLLIKWNQASLPFRRCLTELGVKTQSYFFRATISVELSRPSFMQISPHATARFVFLSSLHLLSFLVPSTKPPTSEWSGLMSITSEAAFWSDSVEGDKRRLIANTEWNNKNDCGGATSVTKRNYAASISKVERHIPDRFCVNLAMWTPFGTVAEMNKYERVLEPTEMEVTFKE